MQSNHRSGLFHSHSERGLQSFSGVSRSEESSHLNKWLTKVVQILRKYAQDDVFKRVSFWIIMLVFINGNIQAQSITELEYFFNADPGVGAATSLSTFTASEEITFTGDLETTSLNRGIHTLFIRAKNSDEEWGLPIKKLVLVDAGEIVEVEQLEYFFDSDPGVGQANLLSVTSGTEIDLTTNLSTNSLTEGIHTLFIRAKAVAGGWGLPIKKLILIDKDDPNTVSIITEAEYFIDADPGFGNGISIDLEDGTEIEENIELNTSELSEGNYIAFIRVKDEDGEWSLIAKQAFEVVDPLITIAEARSLENGTEVTVKGLITRTSKNFVYLQQEQSALMIFSNESSSTDFFNSLQADSLNEGDSLLVTGSLAEFEGLKEILDVTEFLVISSGHDLPESQEVTITEIINNAESYESEIVYVRDLEFTGNSSGAFASATFYTVQKEGTDSTFLFFVHGTGNSEIVGESIPQTTFDYEGILKQVLAEGDSMYVLAPHNPTDITNVAAPVYPTIAEIRELPLGEVVTVKALVTKAKGRFAYIQQDTTAVNMFNPSGTFFDAIADGSVKSGDSLIVTGEVSEFSGLRQLNNVSDFEILSSGNDLPDPIFLTMDELVSSGYKYQAELVKLDSLFITESTTFNFGIGYEVFQRNSSSSAQLYIPNSGDTNLEEVLIPELFSYEGILGQFDPDGNETGHQLRPINQEDIIELVPPVEITAITFKVDMSVQVDNGSFNPDSLTAQIAGNFTGWSTPIDMQIVGDQNYDVNLQFFDPVQGDTAFYKFVYTNNDSIIYEDPDPEISAVATEFNNRFYVFTGQEADTDGDGIKDVMLDRVFFSDDDGSIPLGESISVSIDSVFAFITDTITIPVSISGLAELPMESMEIEFNFNSGFIDIEIAENQTGTILENFLYESSKPVDGSLIVSGATTTAVEEDGDLLFLNIFPQSAGTGGIEVTNLKINEDAELNNPATNFISIIERLCGDVTNDMTVSTLDASYVLRHTVLLAPQYPLMGLDSLAADVTGNGDISAFDASKILQFEVGFIDNLSCKPINAKKKQLFTKANWNMVESNNDLKLNIDISATDFDVYSAQLELDISAEFSFNGVKNVPKNWQVITNKVNGKTKISMFGIQPLKQKELEISIRKNNEFLNSKIKGTIALNESSQADLSELWVNNLPEQFDLSQNYPNPFNPSTNIEYSLPEQSNVRLTIFNMLGQEVATLINNESKKAGVHTVNWNAGSVASGIYFYRLSVGHRVFTKRMMLIK